MSHTDKIDSSRVSTSARSSSPCAPALPQVALFIFHGASRDQQAGVAKPSPAVAKLTAVAKRVVPKLTTGERTQRVNRNPAAVTPAAYPPQEKAEASRATATTHDHLVLQSCTADDLEALDVDSDDEGGAVHPEPPIGISTAQATRP